MTEQTITHTQKKIDITLHVCKLTQIWCIEFYRREQLGCDNKLYPDNLDFAALRTFNPASGRGFYPSSGYIQLTYRQCGLMYSLRASCALINTAIRPSFLTRFYYQERRSRNCGIHMYENTTVRQGQ